MARYYLTCCERSFDPGFGIHLTYDQHEENKAYAAQVARGVARWDAAFGSEA